VVRQNDALVKPRVIYGLADAAQRFQPFRATLLLCQEAAESLLDQRAGAEIAARRNFGL